MNLDNHEYRVVGVLDRWEPTPKFYDLNNNKYGKPEAAFIALHPRHRSADGELGQQQLQRRSSASRAGKAACIPNASGCSSGWSCPPRRTSQHYRAFLNNYAAEQQRSGPVPLAAATRGSAMCGSGWSIEHAVSDEVRILVLVSFSFLLVCLLNAMGLMLAKIMGRAGDIGVRRALGREPRSDFRPVPDRGGGGRARRRPVGPGC